jgi:hypothetical protein
MKLIDKTGGLRPYKNGLYSFLIKYTNQVENFVTCKRKNEYKSLINKDVIEIVIDLL